MLLIRGTLKCCHDSPLQAAAAAFQTVVAHSNSQQPLHGDPVLGKVSLKGNLNPGEVHLLGIKTFFFLTFAPDALTTQEMTSRFSLCVSALLYLQVLFWLW